MKMKHLLCAAIGLGMTLGAMAEGYQVNTLSAKQGGMGHTGVAQHLGAESMYFNPAGLGFMDKTIDLSASFNAVMATARAKLDGKSWETDNDASTPMMVSAAFSIYDNLKAGINFYTPYGSGINWGQSWPGAILNQSVNLVAYTVQPTLSWRITPQLSVGAGLMIGWGNVDLNKGLISPSTMDIMIGQPVFNGSMPASVNLTGTSQVACGVNVGVMYDINKKWTVGANFRSKMTMRVKSGEAAVSYSPIAQEQLSPILGMIDRANFKAEMPMPAVLTFGTAYKPADKWLVAFDAQFTAWSTYKHLNIEFLDPVVAQIGNQHLTKDYKDSWAFRLGAQYGITDRLDLRAGCILDLSPVNKDYYNPETPGMTKIEPSVGLSFRPLSNLSIDLAFLYVAGLGADNARCDYQDTLAKMINAQLPAGAPHLPEHVTFKADYSVHALVPSIGLSYSF